MTAIKTTITCREEKACDDIAKFWVRHHGGVDEWKEHFPRMVELFEDEADQSEIWMCDIVDTWLYDHEMTKADFVRLSGEISGWIVAYSSSFGRLTPIICDEIGD